MPHSEIPGSPIARISPGLFAACHVLHRLSVPRHPPDALVSRLITASPQRRCQPPPRTGPSPMPPRQSRGGGLYEDTSLGPSGTGSARPVRLGHITTLSAPFNQLRADRPPRCRQIFSERRFRHASGAGFAGAMPTSGPPPFQPRSRYAWRAANRWFAGGASRCSPAAPVGRQSFACRWWR